eukprot:1193226-Prorocentrum_minimum.AAC.2
MDKSWANHVPPLRTAHLHSRFVVGVEARGRLCLTKLPSTPHPACEIPVPPANSPLRLPAACELPVTPVISPFRLRTSHPACEFTIPPAKSASCLLFTRRSLRLAQNCSTDRSLPTRSLTSTSLRSSLAIGLANWPRRSGPRWRFRWSTAVAEARGTLESLRADGDDATRTNREGRRSIYPQRGPIERGDGAYTRSAD